MSTTNTEFFFSRASSWTLCQVNMSSSHLVLYVSTRVPPFKLSSYQETIVCVSINAGISIYIKSCLVDLKSDSYFCIPATHSNRGGWYNVGDVQDWILTSTLILLHINYLVLPTSKLFHNFTNDFTLRLSNQSSKPIYSLSETLLFW